MKLEVRKLKSEVRKINREIRQSNIGIDQIKSQDTPKLTRDYNLKLKALEAILSEKEQAGIDVSELKEKVSSFCDELKLINQNFSKNQMLKALKVIFNKLF